MRVRVLLLLLSGGDFSLYVGHACFDILRGELAEFGLEVLLHLGQVFAVLDFFDGGIVHACHAIDILALLKLGEAFVICKAGYACSKKDGRKRCGEDIKS